MNQHCLFNRKPVQSLNQVTLPLTPTACHISVYVIVFKVCVFYWCRYRAQSAVVQLVMINISCLAHASHDSQAFSRNCSSGLTVQSINRIKSR